MSLDDEGSIQCSTSTTIKKRMDSDVETTFSSDSMLDSATPLPNDFFLGHSNRERLYGRFEGIRMASRQKGTEASLADCYRICGIPYPEEFCGLEDKPLSKLELTPPKSASKGFTPQKDVIQPKQPDGSPLSDCPSNISEWEDGKKVRLDTLRLARHS
jgi:hypothetical protein